MRLINQGEALARDRILQSLTSFPINLLKIYPKSFCFKNECSYGLIRTAEAIKLTVTGNRSDVLKDAFHGDCYHLGETLKICDLSKTNTERLMDLFPYTRPMSLRSYPMTIAFGDQLGLAIPGFLRAIRKFEARPILPKLPEQESTGENATRFTQDPVWSVFQESYQDGYGADSTTLNSLQNVKRALDSGASVITLDLSGKMNADVLRESEDLINRKFDEEIDEGDAKVILHLFLDKEFQFRGPEGQFSVRFDEQSVKRNTLLFTKALDFAEEVYEWTRLYRKNRGAIDWGISLEKVPFPISPENHFFLALELSHRGVHLQFLALQFFDDFQDSMNLNGDRNAFHEQLYQHLLIAEDYGYKVSIQGKNPNSSFSDLVGASGRFLQFRLPDSSWIEAVRVIALFRPGIYRAMHSYSLSELNQKSKFQNPDWKRIPNLNELNDEDLPALLEQEECKELFQIACEALLNATSQSGEYIFRNKLYETLKLFEEDYWSFLEASAEKNLSALGVEKKGKKE